MTLNEAEHKGLPKTQVRGKHQALFCLHHRAPETGPAEMLTQALGSR